MEKLPEKWCINFKVYPSQQQIMIDWLNKNCTNGCSKYKVGSISKFLNYPDNRGSHHTYDIVDGYTEIQFKDFKRLVLKENTENYEIY